MEGFLCGETELQLASLREAVKIKCNPSLSLGREHPLMADIFLSYANEDIDEARRLAQALMARGWSVFWDRTIPTGQAWRKHLGLELERARCLVVA